MLGISEIGSKNALLTGTTKDTPSFGSSYNPSFGNTTYHDEFVSSHESGVSAKQIGLFALVGIALGAGVALLLKKPSAASTEVAEELEKIVEYRLVERGPLGKAFDFVTAKNWRAERSAKLEALQKETAEAGVGEVPGKIWRFGRWLNPFNHIGEGAAIVKGKRVAENALNIKLAEAERITNAPIKAAKAQAEADKIVAKAKLDKARTTPAKPVTTTKPGETRPIEIGSDDAVLAKDGIEDKITGTKTAPKRGFFGKIGAGIAFPVKKIGHVAHLAVSSDYRAECKLAARAKSARELEGMDPSKIGVDGPKAKPGDGASGTAKPTATSADAASKQAGAPEVKTTGEASDVVKSTDSSAKTDGSTPTDASGIAEPKKGATDSLGKSEKGK